MTIKRITGTLAPTNPAAITKQTASKINTAANTANLSGIIKPSPAWHHGIVVTNTAPSSEITGLEFISRLRELIHAAGVEELHLEGTLKVVMESKNNRHKTSDFKVFVEAGNISCEEVKFSHLFMPDPLPYAVPKHVLPHQR